MGKKELGGGADFLSVIVLFFLSNYGPGQALRDVITVSSSLRRNRALHERLLRRAADASDSSDGIETPILHYPLARNPSD